MSSPLWHPTPNYLFVAIPERYVAPKGPRSPEGLALTLLAGDDAMAELDAVIKQGGKVHFEEETERSVKNIVRTGLVLQIPPYLDATMTLGGGGPKGLRTFADITPVVEVGETVYLDYTHLIDENEVYPGVYRLPYSAVIAVIQDMDLTVQWRHNSHSSPAMLIPVGGYVLLSRVWADDVVDEQIDGRPVKCRKDAKGWIVQTNVPPLNSEGEVAWVDAPLKGSPDELRPSQRVIISPQHATVETIAGTEYLAVRHDYVLAVREPEVESACATCARKKDAAYSCPKSGGIQLTDTIPLHHPAYNA